MSKPTTPDTQTYTVDVKEVHTHPVTVVLSVDATREEIVEAVHRAISDGDDGDILEYSHTLDSYLWTIRDVLGYYRG